MGIFDHATAIQKDARTLAERTNTDYQRQYDFYKLRDEAGPSIEETAELEKRLNEGMPKNLQNFNTDNRSLFNQEAASGKTIGQMIDAQSKTNREIDNFKLQQQNIEQRIARKEDILAKRVGVSQNQYGFVQGVNDHDSNIKRQNAADARAAANAAAQRAALAEQQRAAAMAARLSAAKTKAIESGGYSVGPDGSIVKNPYSGTGGSDFDITDPVTGGVDTSLAASTRASTDADFISRNIPVIANSGDSPEKDAALFQTKVMLKGMDARLKSKNSTPEQEAADKETLKIILEHGIKGLTEEKLAAIGTGGVGKSISNFFSRTLFGQTKRRSDSANMHEIAEMVESEFGLAGFSKLARDSGIYKEIVSNKDAIHQDSASKAILEVAESATSSGAWGTGAAGSFSIMAAKDEATRNATLENAISNEVLNINAGEYQFSEAEISELMANNGYMGADNGKNAKVALQFEAILKANGNKLPEHTQLPDEVKTMFPEANWNTIKTEANSLIQGKVQQHKELEKVILRGSALSLAQNPEQVTSIFPGARDTYAETLKNSEGGKIKNTFTVSNLYQSGEEAAQAIANAYQQGLIDEGTVENYILNSNLYSTTMDVLKQNTGISLNTPDEIVYESLLRFRASDPGFMAHLGSYDNEGSFIPTGIHELENPNARTNFDRGLKEMFNNSDDFFDGYYWGDDFNRFIGDVKKQTTKDPYSGRR